MKKFIVSFDYKGFTFSAKVFISKKGNSIIYSTQLVEECLGYMFINKELIFTKEDSGYKMLLFSGATKNAKQTFFPLEWHIKNEYVDKTDSLHTTKFSMS